MKTNRPVFNLTNQFLLTVILFFTFQNLCAQAPTITAFTPASGAVGTTVTITGTNFNTTAANNRIVFGATAVAASSATATQLTVKVPMGATYSPITVLNLATKLSGFSNHYFLPTFTPNSGSIVAGSFSTRVYMAIAAQDEYPKANTVADLDGDGKPDLALVVDEEDGNGNKNKISVFRNTSAAGAISYAARQDISIGKRATDITAADLDGDGKPDLVTANPVAEAVSIFKNTSSTGTITFADKIDFPGYPGSPPGYVAISDFDGDGKPDVVALAGGVISILRNTSTGGVFSFVRVDFVNGFSDVGLAIGDIDGDGRTDVVAANYISGKVLVLRNTSIINDITFAPVTFQAVPFLLDVALGDLDGDEKLDIAVPSWDMYGLGLLRNTSTVGTINFAPQVKIDMGYNMRSIAIGDLDGDGKPDLAIQDDFYKLHLLENNSTAGNLTFVASVEIPIGVARGISIADIDGDGKPDIVESFPDEHAIEILRNNPAIAGGPTITSFTPTSAGGGATITITGTNLTGATAVSFGGTAASSFTVVSPTSITAMVAGGASGSVSVTTPVGTATKAGFTFIPALTISSFTPTSAGVGATITITGTNLTGATAVSFGGTAASSFTVVSPTSITAVVAGGASGSVSVTTPDGTGSLAGFTFNSPVTGVEPMNNVAGVDVRVFPNPASGYEINLKFNQSWEDKVATVAIMNISGQVVQTSSITCKSESKLTMNNGRLSSGFYILTLQSGQKNARTRVIVAE